MTFGNPTWHNIMRIQYVLTVELADDPHRSLLPGLPLIDQTYSKLELNISMYVFSYKQELTPRLSTDACTKLNVKKALKFNRQKLLLLLLWITINNNMLYII